MKYKKLLVSLLAFSMVMTPSATVFASEGTEDFSVNYEITYDESELEEPTAELDIVYDDEEETDTIEEDTDAQSLEESADESEELVGAINGTWKGFKWSVNGTTLTIKGDGDMPNATNAPWKTNLYKRTIEKIILDGNITSVGKNAFSDFKVVESIGMPNSIKVLESYCFANCPKLMKGIHLPSNLTTIKEGVFKDSRYLDSRILTNGIINGKVSIAKDAFKGTKVVLNPINMKVRNRTHGVYITWDKVGNANIYGSNITDDSITYNIYRVEIPISSLEKEVSTKPFTNTDSIKSAVSDSNYKKIGSVSGTGKSYTDKTAKNGHFYEYIVRTKVGENENTYTINAKSLTRLTTPAIKSLSSSNSRVTIKWNKVSNVTGYKIVYSTDPTFKTISGKSVIVGASKTGATIKNLKKGKKYYFKLQTYRGINMFGMKENRKFYYSKFCDKVAAITVK